MNQTKENATAAITTHNAEVLGHSDGQIATTQHREHAPNNNMNYNRGLLQQLSSSDSSMQSTWPSHMLVNCKHIVESHLSEDKAHIKIIIVHQYYT